MSACRDCIYWRDMNDTWAGKGQCRRYPPIVNKTDRRGDASWPETTGDKWCGEFFPREGSMTRTSSPRATGPDAGASATPSGSRASHEAPAGLHPTGFDPSRWPAFNMNHEVAVRLTEHGLDILRRNHDRLNMGGLFPGHRPGLLGDFKPPATSDDGWSRFQLWQLMNEFGADIVMGRPVPFETRILLDASAIEARSDATPKSDAAEGESAAPSGETPR